jgi:acetyl esterase/lipase
MSYGTDADHIADVRFGRESAATRPLVVLIHGGFWRPLYDRAHTGPMSVALVEAGWTVASIEYRRVPQHPNFTVDDVALALSVLPEKVSQHDGRVLLVGHSAGGHLALWAAAKRVTERLHGALALAPAADLKLAHELNLGDGAALAFLGEDPRQRADLDPKRMPSPKMKVTVVQGLEDDIVPTSVAESYVAAHPQVRLVTLAATGHFAVIDPLSPVWPHVVAELERLEAP